MKILLFTLLPFIFLVSCVEDAIIQSKPYPIVVTDSVAQLNENGATFFATIIASGTEQIMEHGFIVIHETKYNKKSYTYVVNDSIENNSFQFRCEVNLLPQQKYSAKAYVKTSKYLSKGNAMFFYGRGSGNP